MYLTTAAAVGALAGPWLRAVVFRLAVPFGTPRRTACPRCGRALCAIAGRCPSCGERTSFPCGTTELAAAVALVSVTATVGPRPELIAFGWLALLGVALAAIDAVVHRLPDDLTLPAYPLLAFAFGVAATAHADPSRFLRVLLAGLALAGGYLVLVLIRPDQMGLGDVKLAGLLGMALGWTGWAAVLLATALSFVACAVASLALLAARRARLRTAVPLGPFMIYSTFVVVLVTSG